MHDEGKQLLNLMFRPGETISVSPNKYGYHAIPLENVLNDKSVTLVPTPDSCALRNIEWEKSFEKCDTDKLIMAALNPIKKYREDANCYAFRNFLVEMDVGPLRQQLDYVKKMKMPYSAVIFSGNKSLHFLISLDKDLPDEETYRLFSKWILSVMTLADQNTQNPSRSIRIPGPLRPGYKPQKMVEFNGPVKIGDMAKWLNLHPDAKPTINEKKDTKDVAYPKFLDYVKNRWIRDGLVNGIKQDRNKAWFSIACEFILNGYDLDDTMDFLGKFFIPDRDFKDKEWKTAIRSAYKHVKAKK